MSCQVPAAPGRAPLQNPVGMEQFCVRASPRHCCFPSAPSGRALGLFWGLLGCPCAEHRVGIDPRDTQDLPWFCHSSLPSRALPPQAEPKQPPHLPSPPGSPRVTTQPQPSCPPDPPAGRERKAQLPLGSLNSCFVAPPSCGSVHGDPVGFGAPRQHPQHVLWKGLVPSCTISG